MSFAIHASRTKRPSFSRSSLRNREQYRRSEGFASASFSLHPCTRNHSTILGGTGLRESAHRTAGNCVNGNHSRSVGIPLFNPFSASCSRSFTSRNSSRLTPSASSARICSSRTISLFSFPSAAFNAGTASSYLRFASHSAAASRASSCLLPTAATILSSLFGTLSRHCCASGRSVLLGPSAISHSTGIKRAGRRGNRVRIPKACWRRSFS